MTNPRKMDRPTLQRLRDFIALAEQQSFDALDLVDNSQHRIEDKLRSAVDNLADALDYVDQVVRLHRPSGGLMDLRELSEDEPPAVSGGPASGDSSRESRPGPLFNIGDYVWVQHQVRFMHPDGYVTISEEPGEHHSTDVIPDSPKLERIGWWLYRARDPRLTIQRLIDVLDDARLLRNFPSEWNQRILELFYRLEAIDTIENIEIRKLIESLETPSDVDQD